MNLRYDILYLRFISIISIVLFHLNDKQFVGGFLGVDILLIITGYLNIKTVVKKKIDKEFSYTSFIISKSKRLIPSFLLVLFLCEKYINDEDELYYSLLLMTNYYYYKKNTDYFYKYDDPSPILHYWCITLEYQYYFIMPFLITTSFDSTMLICACLVLSFIIYITHIKITISYCYYCLLPRLYQLLMGYFIKESEYSYDNYYILVLFTFTHIVLLICYYYYLINFNYIYSIYVSIVIHFNVLNIKSLFILLYFSNISYSIYLVHYPLITIFHKSVLQTVIYIIILSILLYYFCEVCAYKIINKISKPIFISAYAIIIYLKYLMKIKKNGNIMLYDKKKLWKDFNRYRHPCIIDPLYHDCNKILLMGDSHIDQWVNAIYNYYYKKGLLIYFIPLGEIPQMNISIVIKKVSEIKNIKAIVISTFKYNQEISNYDQSYLMLQKELLFFSSNIIILNDNPRLNSPSYKCFNKKKAEECYCILGINCSISNLPLYHHTKIHKCDLNKYLCNHKRCQYVIKNRIVYVDFHHLTPYITKYLSHQLIRCINLKNTIINCNLNNSKCFFYINKNENINSLYGGYKTT